MSTDYDARCAMLAAYHLGATKRTIAQLFGVSVHTVSSIVKPSSPKYADVREGRERMGPFVFDQYYLNGDMRRRLSAAQTTQNTTNHNLR